MTRYAVLTPPGTGAIAVLTVSGPDAWPLVLRRFRPAGKPLPESPTLHAVRLGTLGDGAGDEVVVAVTQVSPEVTVEVHCHGGPQVVRMLCDLFDAEGCRRAEWWEIWFILNTNADPVMVPEPSHGTDLLTGKALAGPLDLAGYGCAVGKRS